jgi:deazaflavin-dependent oxidoreductase (nitroreductase family)
MRLLFVVTLAAIATIAAFVIVYPTKFGHRYLVPAFYRGGRPTAAGRRLNRSWSWLASTGLLPERWPGRPAGPATIETTGRKSGLPSSHMVTWVEYDGERYLVSMLGERSDWVLNARAADGDAVIRRGKRRPVQLVEIPPAESAPIIQKWYKITWTSTLPHLGIDPESDIEEFEKIASSHPVFRIAETFD